MKDDGDIVCVGTKGVFGHKFALNVMKYTVGSEDKNHGASGASLADARARRESVPGGTSEVEKVLVVFVQLLYSIYYMVGHAYFAERSENEVPGDRRESGLEVKEYSSGGRPATSRSLNKGVFHFQNVFQNVPPFDEATLFDKGPLV